MTDGPLRGQHFAISPGTAAGACARTLATCLGADVTDDGDDLGLAGSSASIDWATSGAMALTGRADSPPRLVDGAPASVVRAALALLGTPTSAGVQVLGERAAAAGLGRRAPWSPGGAFRMVRARDGWLGLSLARDSDLDLLPALVGADVQDPWSALEGWAGSQSVAAAEERGTLLGLPMSAVPVAGDSRRAPVLATRGGGRASDSRVVLDLTSLWAGPLCAHLLGETGARVIKVESADRIDGARRGPSAFFDLLHAGHESVVLDFGTESGRAALAGLIDAADLVLEAARPRALEQLGVDAAEVVASGTSWVSITAYGRDEANALRVGFGDDVAASAGLVCWDGDRPIPVGDAIADPLAGVVAAAAAAAALASRDAWLLDVSMHDVAALAASVPPDGAELFQTADAEWQVQAGEQRVAVAEPAIRPAKSAAATAGRDTDSVLAEFAPS